MSYYYMYIYIVTEKDKIPMYIPVKSFFSCICIGKYIQVGQGRLYQLSYVQES